MHPDGHRFRLGAYASEAEAAWAYDAAPRILFVPFARIDGLPAEQAPSPGRRRDIERDIERRLARVEADELGAAAGRADYHEGPGTVTAHDLSPSGLEPKIDRR